MEKRFCTSTPIVPHNNNSNMKTLKFTQCTLNAIAARLAQESEPRVLRCGAHVSSYPARFHDWTTWLLMVLHRCQPRRHVRLHAETREGCGVWRGGRAGRSLGGGHCSHAIHSVQGTHTRTQECTQETQTTLIKHVFFFPQPFWRPFLFPSTSLLLLFFVCFQFIWRVFVTHQTHLNSRWRVWREKSLFFKPSHIEFGQSPCAVKKKKKKKQTEKKERRPLAVVKQSLDLGLALAYHYSAQIICSGAFGGGKKVYCIPTLSIHTSPESYISTFQPVAREKLGTEAERETLCQLTKVDILKRTLFMKQEHCIVIVWWFIKLISHSIVWALIYFTLFEQDDEKSPAHQPPLDYGPRCKDTYIKAQGVGWWLPLFASLWIISCYHARRKSGREPPEGIRICFMRAVLHICNREITLVWRRSYFINFV